MTGDAAAYLSVGPSRGRNLGLGGEEPRQRSSMLLGERTAT